MKIVNIEGENLLNDLRNFNELFGRNVAYDSIKSHKKLGFHTLSRKHISGKTTGGGGQIDPPSLFRVKRGSVVFYYF